MMESQKKIYNGDNKKDEKEKSEKLVLKKDHEEEEGKGEGRRFGDEGKEVWG